jgi:hypothetical protein
MSQERQRRPRPREDRRAVLARRAFLAVAAAGWMAPLGVATTATPLAPAAERGVPFDDGTWFDDGTGWVD